MRQNLREARRILEEHRMSCVLYRDGTVFESNLRGVAPLMEFLDGSVDVQDFSAADKVVGKAAAFLYCLLDVKEVYADVISRPALDVLQDFGIAAEYGALTDRILNRSRQGYCPMESAVRDVSSPERALTVIRASLKTKIL